MRTLLDFEKPIAELESKLEDMKRLANENNVDVSGAVRTLNDNIEQLKKETFANLTRWQRVQLSRHPDRPYTLDYIERICQEFHELHGDRTVKDDPAIVDCCRLLVLRSLLVIQSLLVLQPFSALQALQVLFGLLCMAWSRTLHAVTV